MDTQLLPTARYYGHPANTDTHYYGHPAIMEIPLLRPPPPHCHRYPIITSTPQLRAPFYYIYPFITGTSKLQEPHCYSHPWDTHLALTDTPLNLQTLPGVNIWVFINAFTSSIKHQEEIFTNFVTSVQAI